MAKTRKDLRGRSLRKGEVQRQSDKRYMYTYRDPLGRRKYIYAMDLAELREKEAKLMKDQLDGLDLYVAGKASLNDTFDRYMSAKYNLRESTRSAYEYTYDHYIRDTFGRKRIAEIKYSDVLQFYYYLLNQKEISLGTLDSIHCLLHPTFQLAVRDEIIRKNPTDGVMKEISRESGKNRGVRHALTVQQQRVFMEYIANHPIYFHWWPMFTILLGTGCRIGEALGLRWQDLDFENRVISINHSLVYYQTRDSKKCMLRVSLPKTEAGIRTIPMLDIVKDAFEMLYEEQEENGFNETEIDGMTGFIFCNRFGGVPNPQTVNHTIKRILNQYNADEVVRAKKERREPIILPDFSCHHLRHTFCTRLCEHETNLKVIQAIMGHKNIETTMDIYAEATEEKKQESFENLAANLDIF
ncbi:site-specific integrase [Mediterraneibacter glycyrrhizinilyticus]|uniref:tyrosine-type recombinase/integrase n=1 Tax=Mediterraneibacter glycyrrhizinilyticus TaxID=342942 RepID=UPI00195FCB1A|nr:site-specific integrase [Mediterraneibacter glycyrrhizinilyticus]MBM6751652.1 site-specific integrase [Mediterraneibacter glycyrrhizinilyticus]